MAYLNKIVGIYTIMSIIDNKYYIGRSYNCYERFSKHKCLLRKGIHNNDHLQSAWDKYGELNFKFDILDENEIEILPSLENWWCNLLNTHNKKFGYNIDPTSPYGKIKNSKETREKIRISNTGSKCSIETKEKLRNYNIGKKQSEDTILKLRDSEKNIKIDMYDKYGNFIKTFKSLREAERSTNISIKGISECLSGKFNLIKEKIFKIHGDVLNKEELEYRNKNSLDFTKIKVIGYNIDDDSIIGEFDSFYQAGKFTKLDPYKISLCCKGKQKRVKNTIWKYIKKEDS